MFNVQQITSRLSEMSDTQLAQYARMHKDDPYLLPMASSEFKRRQQDRLAAAGQQGGPKPTIADQDIAEMAHEALPEDQGIGVLPAQNIATMADGGIAGYAEGGEVGFAGGGKSFDPDPYLQNPNVQKFLAYINAYEGSPQANHTFGKREIASLEEHPNKPIRFTKKGDVTTAAGLFQIINKTWKEQKKKLGLDDFSPTNQERAAVGILKDVGALDDVVKGNFEAAKKKAGKQWASLPGSTIGEATGQIPRVKPQIEAMLQPVKTAEKEPATRTPARKDASVERKLIEALPIASATAAETVPRGEFKPPVAEQGIAAAVPQDRYIRTSPQSISGPITRQGSAPLPTVPAQGITALPAAPVAPKPAPKAPAVADDTIYDPMTGAPIAGGVPYQAGPKTESPVAAQLTGTADVVLGIPEAVANVVAQDYYNMPVGKQYTWAEAREAAKKNPIVKAAGYLRSGKWFGVENDPAYRTDPLSVIASLPSLGVQGIADQFGLDKDAAQLALDNALLLTPALKRIKAPEYNVPKLPGKEIPKLGEAEAVVEQAKADLAAREKAVEAPRLGYTPQTATTVTPGGIATLPKAGIGAEAAASAERGRLGLAEDLAAREAAARRLEMAEAARARAAENKPGAAEAFLAQHPWTRRGIAVSPFAALSAGTDVSGGGPRPGEGPEGGTPAQAGAYKYGDQYAPSKVEEAKKVAEEVTTSTEAEKPATGGFSNEDILMMGLNMLQAPAGQSGNDLSQLFSNVGRSGLATLQAKREREKLAAEQSYKDLYGKYIGKLAEHVGAPTGEQALVEKYAKDRGLGFADAYEEITGFKSRAAYVRSYDAQAKDPINGDAFRAKYPTVESYLQANGIGGYEISPVARAAMNQVLGKT